MNLRKTAKGFTLIEILVAMLLMAIGLLGLAAMTVVVMRSNTLSQQISDATNVASDLMDRVRRANPGSQANTDCSATTDSITDTTCPALYKIKTSFPTFLPQLTNGTGADGTTAVVGSCGLSGIVGGTGLTTFEIVDSSTLAATSTFTSAQKICDSAVTGGTTLGQNKFLRYYRTYRPAAAASPTERTIVVVVLWKDRFGNWQNVHFSTSQ